MNKRILMLSVICGFSAFAITSCNLPKLSSVKESQISIKQTDNEDTIQKSESEEESDDKPTACKISWKNYDGSLITVTNVFNGETPAFPIYNEKLPTKPNSGKYKFTFVGWEPELGPVTTDTVYTAKFSSEEMPVKVRWLKDNGEVFKEEEYEIGDSSINVPTEHPDNTDSNYEWVFTGWKTDNNKTPTSCRLDGSTMLYTFKPVYEKQRFNITWKNYDGTSLDSNQAISGIIPSTTKTPKQKPNSGKYKYKFDGWEPALSEAHSDQTYTAKFKEEYINIAVNFYEENGTTPLSLKSDYHIGDIISAPTAPAKAKEGETEFEFDYWEGLNGETYPTSALDGTRLEYNFKAVYKIKGFQVKFVDYDGDLIKTIPTATANSNVGDAAYTTYIPSTSEMNERANDRANDRYSYQFVGWALGDSSETDPVEDSTTHLIPKDAREGVSQEYLNLSTLNITSNMTLHAVYNLNLKSYDVKFYGKDEDESLGSLTVDYGSDVSFDGHGFTTPTSFNADAADGSGTTEYTWNTGFQYKDGETWVSGFTKVKKDVDYFATYNTLWVPKTLFYFTSTNDFSVALNKTYASYTPDLNLEYSLDGTTWNTYTNTMTSAVIEQTANKKICFRGTNNPRISYSEGCANTFALTGTNIRCKGNIESLLDYKTVNAGNRPTITTNTYNRTFYKCTNLIEAPYLPATSVEERGYMYMFQGCSSLVDVQDELPITTLGKSCCAYMFKECTSLKKAPNLPATSLSNYCYNYMFAGDTSLTTAPTLPATTLSMDCYAGMFSDCTSLVNAPALPATNLAESCYSCMFTRCKSMISAPTLPATTLADWCYSSMFSSCIALTNASDLPALTTVKGCYKFMFDGCSALTKSPALPSTTLTATCYQYMFRNCSSLKEATSLPASTLAEECYNYMYQGCSSLKISQNGSGTKIFTCPSTIPNMAVYGMFESTGGTFVGKPTASNTYYYYL